MTEDPSRWSQPFAALLGAYEAQLGFGLPSIGGKDSMSGTFEDIDVPPTLCSFAVDVAREGEIITPELKTAGENSSLPTEQRGHVKSSGSSSNGVPAGMPASGNPTAGSYSQPHTSHTYFFIICRCF